MNRKPELSLKWNNLCDEAKRHSGIYHIDTSIKPSWYDDDKFKEGQNYLKENYLM